LIDQDFIATKSFGEIGRYALLTVTDTGTGMDPNMWEKIFEPFFTTKEVGKGTGLGLAMVYGAVHQHNGFIEVASQPGEGATFSIYLPIVRSAPQQENLPQHLIAPRGTETILLAEDNDEVRKIMRMILTEYGYSVIEAVDGEDAIEKFLQNQGAVALLLSDLVMPRKNGKDAYRAIQALKPELKVLFISGYAAEVGLPQDLSGRQSDYIPKTAPPSVLLTKIRQILDS
jgi:CheY-like chemotaxis protein